MSSIDLMIHEHDNILVLLSCIRNACCGILEGQSVEESDFRDMIQLARSYADRHHHGKEEQILFREMTAHLGSTANNLIRHGMLVEHDLGRLHIRELEAALDRYHETPSTREKLNIIAEAAGYASLLQRHIEKENEVVYPFAARSLPQEVLEQIDQEVQLFEEQADVQRAGSLQLLSKLAKKYAEPSSDIPYHHL